MQINGLLFPIIRWLFFVVAICMVFIVFPLFERFVWMQMRMVLSPMQIEQLKLMRGGAAILLILLVHAGTRRFLSPDSHLSQGMRVVSVFVTNKLVSVVLIGGLILFFLGWLPHYLFWPMWMDAEHFAISAQSWDAGIRPYRDLIDFNFPGPIYFYWMIGKVFGWGKPMMANLADALVLIGFGSAVLCWSKRVFASWNPGLVACLLMARYYMSLDYARVMQRDWYVFVFGTLAILVIQAWKNENRWALAGILLSTGLVIRPYAVLWFVPVGLSLFMQPRDEARQIRHRFFSLTLSVVISSIVLWMPLFLSQIFDDFLGHLLQELLYSNYRSQKDDSLKSIVWDEIARATEFTSLVGLVACGMLPGKNKELRSDWLVWCSVFTMMILYKPLCPVRHEYTMIPLSMTSCLVIGFCFGLMMHATHFDLSVFVIASVIWAHFYHPGWPQMGDFQASSKAIQAFVNWENLKQPPPGCRDVFRAVVDDPNFYHWQDYQGLLDYIRHEVPEDVRVVNFLLYRPFPAVNAPTGRLSLWPCGEGILWLSWVHKSMEPDFARALDAPVPAIVILSDERLWWPPPNRFPAIEKKIRAEFEQVSRHGAFQVWARRKAARKSSFTPQKKIVAD